MDGRQLEQIKAALLQQIQQQQQRRDVMHDDRRLAADRMPTEFELRERQRQEEIRRRQVGKTMLSTLSSLGLDRYHAGARYSILLAAAVPILEMTSPIA